MTTDREAGWQKFLYLCQQCENTMQLTELLDLLFTLEEKEQLAMRVLLIEELLDGKKTQRQMAHDLGLSVAKITRGSNALKIISSKLRDFLAITLLKSPEN